MAHPLTIKYQNENRHLIVGGDFFQKEGDLPVESQKRR